MPDARRQRASHSSGTAGEVDRIVLRLRFAASTTSATMSSAWSSSGGEANSLPAELVSDRAFVRLGIFWGHRSLRSQESKLFN
jgi:hypothetical protein